MRFLKSATDAVLDGMLAMVIGAMIIVFICVFLVAVLYAVQLLTDGHVLQGAALVAIEILIALWLIGRFMRL